MAANKTFWWDAPKGYKAVKVSPAYCNGCAYSYKNYINECLNVACTPRKRKDKQFVIFIKRENHA